MTKRALKGRGYTMKDVNTSHINTNGNHITDISIMEPKEENIIENKALSNDVSKLESNNNSTNGTSNQVIRYLKNSKFLIGLIVMFLSISVLVFIISNNDNISEMVLSYLPSNLNSNNSDSKDTTTKVNNDGTVSITDKKGNTTTYDKNGNQLSVVDKNGNKLEDYDNNNSGNINLPNLTIPDSENSSNGGSNDDILQPPNDNSSDKGDSSDTDSSENIDYTSQNNQIIGDLQRKYNINIIINSDYTNSHMMQYIAEPIVKSQEINKMLINLSYELSLYPDTFFNDFYVNNIKYNLRISFASRLNGVSEYNKPNAAILSVESNNSIDILFRYTPSNFNRLFHYYIYYAIEYILSQKHGDSFGYNNFNNLNPNGFGYGKIDQSLIYKPNLKDSWFFSTQSQLNSSIDRATIFTIFISDQRKQFYFNDGHNIRLKLDSIINTLSNNFQSVSKRKLLGDWNPKYK